MAKKGKCISIGNGCVYADSRQVIELPETADFVCPGCGCDLIPTAEKQHNNNPWRKRGIFLLPVITAIICIVLYHCGTQPTIVDTGAKKDTPSAHSTTTAAPGSQATAPSHSLPPAVMHKDSVVTHTADSIKAVVSSYFTRLADPSSSAEDKQAWRVELLALFVSGNVPVVKTHSGYQTPTGINIDNYINSVITLRKHIKTYDITYANNKIAELKVEEQ